MSKKIILFTILCLSLPAVAFAQISVDPNDSATFGLGSADLETTVINIVQWVLGLLGLIAIIMIIASVIIGATAKEEERAEKAKKALIGSIVGLVIILVAWAIVTFVIGSATELTA